MSNTSNASKNVKRFLLLFAFGIAYGFMYVMPYMKSSFYDQMIAAMGCTNAQLGSLMTAYCICCTVSYLPGGWIGDKFNPKPVLLISIFGQAALSFLFMFTYKSYTMAVIIWLLMGLTGGQMAPTTLPHQKTATSPKGKDPARYGTLNVVDVLGKMDIAYLACGELVGPAGMNNCKKLIRKAFEHQLNGDGFSLVELLSPCPTNLNMPPVKAREHVRTEMTKYFPIGEYIDKKGGNQA